jgi:hypothetical protein
MVSYQDTGWKVFPRFLVPTRSTLLLGTEDSRGCVAGKSSKDERTIMQERQRSSARSARLGKRLDPDLKSWLDNVIIPALVREYMAEIKKQNQLASAGPSEVTSDKGR